ncbi:MAG: hypothetical protein HYR91_08240 [Flavobacteriia bacterium]|nr:hypothetical protein [Flavobacteriia bacterium]
MYKYIIIFLFPSICFGQRSKLRYSYEVYPYFEKANNQLIVDTLILIDETNLILKFYDSENCTIQNLEIQLSNKDTVINLYTDTLGLIYLKTKYTLFKLHIDDFRYKKTESLLTISKNKLLKYTLILASNTANMVYKIKSREELSQEEINDIKECIETNSDITICECEEIKISKAKKIE